MFVRFCDAIINLDLVQFVQIEQAGSTYFLMADIVRANDCHVSLKLYSNTTKEKVIVKLDEFLELLKTLPTNTER